VAEPQKHHATLARSSVPIRGPLSLVPRGDPVGRDTIRYFLYLNGRWRWRPTRAMRAQGFGLV
jgi:hypothetical protein